MLTGMKVSMVTQEEGFQLHMSKSLKVFNSFGVYIIAQVMLFFLQAHPERITTSIYTVVLQLNESPVNKHH